jgi:hypothetical protein
MSQAAPIKLVEPFAKNAPSTQTPGGKTNPFPVASQIPLGLPGNASLDDGFTPLNMTPLISGGIPPRGSDMNGILYLYGTIIACVSAGQLIFPYDGTYATAIAGYAVGAQVQDATTALQRWTAAVASPRDPAAHPEDWISNIPLKSPSAPTAGTHADNVLPGPSDFFLEITGTGAVQLNGFVAQRDGQKLILSNLSASALTIGALLGTAANQVRMSSNITLLQNDSLTIQYNTAIGKWIQV